MNDTYDYYDYSEDLLARKRPGSGAFEIFVGGNWEPCFNYLKFSFTAQKIRDVDRFKRENPKLGPAFDGPAPPGAPERARKAVESYSRPFDESQHKRGQPENAGQFTAMQATQSAKQLSNGLESEKGFMHGIEDAHRASALASAGDHQGAAEAHLSAAKKIAKGRTGWLGGHTGGKAHDRAEMAHVDAAELHKQAHQAKTVAAATPAAEVKQAVTDLGPLDEKTTSPPPGGHSPDPAAADAARDARDAARAEPDKGPRVKAAAEAYTASKKTY